MVAFLLALSPEQRDHIHMKTGLRPSPGPEADLYADLEVSEVDAFQLPRALEAFLMDHEATVTRADLIGRACDTEFESIAAKIRTEL
ncbi:hypothetical protein DCE94_14040 [Agromyces badenianii]|nr:hypothetical protein DCE94_14040 [Agromyces badenianii]